MEECYNLDNLNNLNNHNSLNINPKRPQSRKLRLHARCRERSTPFVLRAYELAAAPCAMEKPQCKIARGCGAVATGLGRPTHQRVQWHGELHAAGVAEVEVEALQVGRLPRQVNLHRGQGHGARARQQPDQPAFAQAAGNARLR